MTGKYETEIVSIEEVPRGGHIKRNKWIELVSNLEPKRALKITLTNHKEAKSIQSNALGSLRRYPDLGIAHTRVAQADNGNWIFYLWRKVKDEEHRVSY